MVEPMKRSNERPTLNLLFFISLHQAANKYMQNVYAFNPNVSKIDLLFSSSSKTGGSTYHLIEATCHIVSVIEPEE